MPRMAIVASVLFLMWGCQSPFGRDAASPPDMANYSNSPSPPPQNTAAGSQSPWPGAQSGVIPVASYGDAPVSGSVSGGAMTGGNGPGAESVSYSLNLGLTAFEQGRLDQANSHFSNVLQIQPRNAIAHHRLAVISDLQQEFATAESHYLQALSVNPRDADLLSDVGYSYLLQEKFGEAERYLQRAIQVNASHKKALNNLGYLYGKQGDANRALAAFRRSGSETEALEKIAKLFPNGVGNSNQTPVAPEINMVSNATESDSASANPEIDKLMRDMAMARQESRNQRQSQYGEALAAPNPAARHTQPGYPPSDFSIHDSNLPPTSIDSAAVRNLRNADTHPSQQLVDPNYGMKSPDWYRQQRVPPGRINDAFAAIEDSAPPGLQRQSGVTAHPRPFSLRNDQPMTAGPPAQSPQWGTPGQTGLAAGQQYPVGQSYQGGQQFAAPAQNVRPADYWSGSSPQPGNNGFQPGNNGFPQQSAGGGVQHAYGSTQNDAARKAAMMAMDGGPLPLSSRVTPSQVPGTDSRINGAYYPSPSAYPNSQMNPQLQPGSFPSTGNGPGVDAGSLSPVPGQAAQLPPLNQSQVQPMPTNSGQMGQQFAQQTPPPMASYPAPRYDSTNTGMNTTDPRALSTSGLSTNPLAAYDEQRRQQNDDYNRIVQELDAARQQLPPGITTDSWNSTPPPTLEAPQISPATTAPQSLPGASLTQPGIPAQQNNQLGQGNSVSPYPPQQQTAIPPQMTTPAAVYPPPYQNNSGPDNLGQNIPESGSIQQYPAARYPGQ